jgi:arabinogalactan endo-1,4-beta-galactosidase
MTLTFLLLYFFVLGSHALTYHGADISSLPLVESQGVKFTDAGTVSPFETILKSHGMNTARIRVWTAGQYSTSYALSLAKRVKAAGMTLAVDLHYSDTCAHGSRWIYLLVLTEVRCIQGQIPVTRRFPQLGRPPWPA